MKQAGKKNRMVLYAISSTRGYKVSKKEFQRIKNDKTNLEEAKRTYEMAERFSRQIVDHSELEQNLIFSKKYVKLK